MKKPITIARDDFIHCIATACNESDLPAFVKADVLEKLLVVLQDQIEKEYRRDAEMYQNAIQEEQKKHEVEKRMEVQRNAMKNMSMDEVNLSGRQTDS